MAHLSRVYIKGFRSLKEVELELRSLNVLIGANGAGKSNFVSFFKLLNEMMAGRLQEYIGKTGRTQANLHFGPRITPQLEAKLEFEADNGRDTFEMRLFHAAGDTLVFADERLSFLQRGFARPKVISLGAGHVETRIGEEADKDEPIAKAFRYFLNRCRVYHFHDTSLEARARQYGYIGDNRSLMHDAGNLAALLYALKQKPDPAYRRIVSVVRKVMPGFDDFVLEPDTLNPRDIMLNWRKLGSDYLFGPHQLSDGTLRAIALVTLLLQPTEQMPDVLLLDEPELGLHPFALGIVGGLIRAASVHCQVIVATQSRTFLDHFDPAEIVVVDSRNGGSHYQRLDPARLKDWLEDYAVGELWERNVLGGGPIT